MAAYIPVTKVLSFRWAEWIMLISDALIIVIIIIFKRETMAPQILKYKSRHLRALTGDNRFKTTAEAKGETLLAVVKTNFTRPFMFAPEPIVFLFTFYLTVM